MLGKRLIKVAMIAMLSISLSSCYLITTSKPSNIDHICTIFKERPHWQRAVFKASNRWNVPVPMIMSIIYQESSFRRYAQPTQYLLLGSIPMLGSSGALGFSQAIGITWKEYVSETSNDFAMRTSFDDSVDFIGWYVDKSARLIDIARTDAFGHYLAYHEGRTGYKRKTYNSKSKKWLLGAAKKVRNRTANYKKQLLDCY